MGRKEMGPFQLTSMAYIVQPNRKKRGSLDIVVLLVGYWTPLHGSSTLFCIHFYPSIYAIDVLFFSFSFLVFCYRLSKSWYVEDVETLCVHFRGLLIWFCWLCLYQCTGDRRSFAVLATTEIGKEGKRETGWLPYRLVSRFDTRTENLLFVFESAVFKQGLCLIGILLNRNLNYSTISK